MTASQEQQTSLQRPDLGVELVIPADPIEISQKQLPWMTGEILSIPTVLVHCEDGTEFRFGSAVKANHTVEKLADKVSVDHSQSVERGLFKALPAWIKGQDAPNIDHVAVGSELKVNKVAKRGKDAPRLYFARVDDKETGVPTILKLAIVMHNDQSKLMGVLTGNKGQRQKHDG